MGEGLGKAALAAILAGIYVYVLATFLAGLKGQPVDIYKFFEGNGLDGFNLVASIAAFVLAVGDPARARRTSPTAGGTACAPGTTRGAARRSSGSRSRPRRSTTSTPSPTSAAPSPCTTSAGRSASAPRLAPAGAARGRRQPSRSRRGRAGASRGRLRRRLGSLSSMNRVAPRGEADELARFRRLLNATIAHHLRPDRDRRGGPGERLRPRLRRRRQRHRGLAAVRRPGAAVPAAERGDRVQPPRRGDDRGRC